MNTLDIDSEMVEIKDLSIEDFLDFARYGEIEALQIILESEHSEKLAACDENKISLLHMIAGNGHLECAKLILNCPRVRDISINLTNTEGNTPLHWAALNSHVSLVLLLLENGADLNIKNLAGRTAFDEAVTNEKFDVTASIIDYLEKNQVINQNEAVSDCSNEDIDSRNDNNNL